ncbi:hypothetical protein BH11CYA1_BH11CYA1_39240 [soil metagenome]
MPQIPPNVVTCIDAAGLSLFCLAGAAKAHEYKINNLMSILMGTITGVGGGAVRDMLLARVPGILNVDVYAVAAMLGDAITILGIRAKLPRR